MPPSLPPLSLFAEDVEEENDDEDCEEDGTRSGRYVECAVAVLEGTFSVDEVGVEDGTVVIVTELEDVTCIESELDVVDDEETDVEVEEVESKAIEAL